MGVAVAVPGYHAMHAYGCVTSEGEQARSDKGKCSKANVLYSYIYTHQISLEIYIVFYANVLHTHAPLEVGYLYIPGKGTATSELRFHQHFLFPPRTCSFLLHTGYPSLGSEPDPSRHGLCFVWVEIDSLTLH